MVNQQTGDRHVVNDMRDMVVLVPKATSAIRMAAQKRGYATPAQIREAVRKGQYDTGHGQMVSEGFDLFMDRLLDAINQ